MKIPRGWREGHVEDLQRKLAAAERRNDELTEGIRVNNEALAVMQRQRDEAESAISRYEVRVAELERLCDQAQAARGMAERDRAEMAARLATLEGPCE